MPYKRDADRRAYMRRYHERTRASPAPEPQRSGALPPAGQLIADDDGSRVQCHVCGRFFGWLPSHIVGTHHLRVDAYKARFGLARGLSLASPRHAERQRQARARIDPGGQLARQHLPTTTGRPAGTDHRLSTRIRESASHRRPPPTPAPDSRLGTRGSKLDDQQRRAIAALHGHENAATVAPRFGVTAAYVRKIWRPRQEVPPDN